MRSLLAIFGAAGLVAVAAQAENWPQWRGPYFNGSSAEKGLPARYCIGKP